MTLRQYIVVCFVLLFTGIASGQDTSFKIIDPEFELKMVRLNSTEDLGQFNDIIEDDEGYVWFSSATGMHVFDGNRTITYTGNKGQFGFATDSISRPFIFLNKAGNHRLWIQQSGNRLVQFNTQQRNIESVDDFFQEEDKQILSSHKSQGGPLYLFWHNSKEKSIALSRKGDGKIIQTLFTAPVENLGGLFTKLMGKELWVFKNGYFSRLDREGKIIKNYETRFQINNAVSVWAGDTSFYFIDQHTYTIFKWDRTSDELLPFLKIPPTVKAGLSGLWIEGDKVYIADNLYLYILNTKDRTQQDLSKDFLTLIKNEAHGGLGVNFLKFTKRKDGTLWVSNLRSVLQIKEKPPLPTQFKQPIIDKALLSSTTSCRALAEDKDKNIYASYYGGIAMKKPGDNSFKAVGKWHDLINEAKGTYSLNVWNNHLIWNNVIIDLKDNSKQYVGLPHNAGHCNQWIQNDTLWVYIWHTPKLYCYDLKRKRQTETRLKTQITGDGTYYSAINDIKMDERGQHFWISSTFKGIQLVSKSGQLLKQFDQKGLHTADNDIQEIEVDGDQLWFGCTLGLGRLNILTGAVSIFKNPFINSENIMQNRTIFSILPDEQGNLYLGSSFGLLYFDTRALQFYNLVKGHPLSEIEFNKMATLKASDGRYYFGSTDGLFSFMPDELQFVQASNKIKPLKLISTAIFDLQKEKFNYEYRHLNTLQELVLQPTESSLELQFSVPEYSNEVYYSYRIKEQSKQWTAPKLDNKIFLYGLEPGTHTLEVRASTGISEKEASLYTITIIKKQVWYKRAWVIAVFTLLFSSLVFVFLRYRFNQKLRRQKELADLRTKISADLHDEVGTLLSGLAMQSQILAIEANEENKEVLNEISSMGREAMERMRDTVWAIDSRKDKVENLIDRMRDFAEKNLPIKKMTHEFVNQVEDAKKFIDPERRQNIYLIFKEAITNIIKHSDGSHVMISLSEDRGRLRLMVKDNGSQKPQTRSDGQGLGNMKMRAQKIGGELTFGFDHGFVVELWV